MRLDERQEWERAALKREVLEAELAKTRRNLHRDLWTLLSEIKESTTRVWSLVEKLGSIGGSDAPEGNGEDSDVRKWIGDKGLPLVWRTPVIAFRNGDCQVKCKSCGHWNTCPRCNGWICEHCGADLSDCRQPVEEVRDGKAR